MRFVLSWGMEGGRPARLACERCGARMKLMRELPWLGPACRRCGSSSAVTADTSIRSSGRRRLTAVDIRTRGEAYSMASRDSSGLGSARPGLSQKGGLPSRR